MYVTCMSVFSVKDNIWVWLSTAWIVNISCFHVYLVLHVHFCAEIEQEYLDIFSKSKQIHNTNERIKSANLKELNTLINFECN